MIARTFSRRFSIVTRLLSVSLTISLLLLACLGPLSSQAQNKSPYSKERLLTAIRTNKQTGELSTKQLVGYIEQRGVDFEMTTPDEARFRNAGAPPEVIAAIRSNYRATLPPRSLTVKSMPGCNVFLNGQLRGTTNDAGALVLQSLKLGPHKLTLRKPNYRDEERTITVTTSGLMEYFTLVPLAGRLNVTCDVVGARIAIRNVGEYSEKITDLELSPGSYEIEVSKPGYRTFTRRVVLAAGAPFYLPVALEKMSIDEMVTQAKENYDKHNYPAAMVLARSVLSIQPEHPKANDLMGGCLYFKGQYDDAIPYLAKAIAGGEPTVIPVLHKHGGSWNGKTLSPGRLTFYRESLEFYSTDYPDQSFRIPYTSVTEMSVKDQNAHLNLKVRMKLPKNRKETQEEYNFYSTDAVATGVLVTCSQCSSTMRFTLQLLRHFRPGS